MKKFICLIASLAGLLTVSEAQADNFYVGGFAGPNWVTSQRGSRTGWLAGVDVGYRWCNGFRTELEYSYRNVETRNRRHSNGCCDNFEHRRKRDIHSNAVLFNVLYDFDTCYCVKPFIGGGIGWANQRLNRHHHDGEEGHHHRNRKNNFAWQFIAGIAYPINDCTDLEISYRLFRVENNNRDENREGGRGHRRKPYSNGLAFGVNYNF